jgi:hypothetical protein
LKHFDSKILFLRSGFCVLMLSISFFMTSCLKDASLEQDSEVAGRNSSKPIFNAGQSRVKSKDMVADCWDDFGGQHYIKVQPLTELNFNSTSRKKHNDWAFVRDSVSGYWGYKVTGPNAYLAKSKVYAKSGNGEAELPGVKLKSCWIEEKYLDLSSRILTSQPETQEIDFDSTQLELSKEADYSYLKLEINSEKELRSEIALKSEATADLSLLPTRIHNPKFACLIVSGTRIQISGIDKSLGQREGHVFVKFESREVNRTLGIVPDVQAPKSWASQAKMIEHWKELFSLYADNLAWKSGSPDRSLTALPVCELEKSGGWVKVSDFNFSKK